MGGDLPWQGQGHRRCRVPWDGTSCALRGVQQMGRKYHIYGDDAYGCIDVYNYLKFTYIYIYRYIYIVFFLLNISLR